ncbi:MAG TPA: MarR family transcriptional regulator [Actinomycetales bacterium]|nr:MarR family transcriptional regulator [Actinomycetales bacterium]
MAQRLGDDEKVHWGAVLRLVALLPARLERDLAEVGLSAADYDVLSTLADHPGHRLSLKDLANAMHWSSSRLSHHATRMERRGLLQRQSDPRDARGCLIELTDEGEATLHQAAPVHVASVRAHFLDHVSPHELAQLGEVARRITDRLL